MNRGILCRSEFSVKAPNAKYTAITKLSRTILHGRHAISCRSSLAINISIGRSLRKSAPPGKWAIPWGGIKLAASHRQSPYVLSLAYKVTNNYFGPNPKLRGGDYDDISKGSG